MTIEMIPFENFAAKHQLVWMYEQVLRLMSPGHFMAEMLLNLPASVAGAILAQIDSSVLSDMLSESFNVRRQADFSFHDIHFVSYTIVLVVEFVGTQNRGVC